MLEEIAAVAPNRCDCLRPGTKHPFERGLYTFRALRNSDLQPFGLPRIGEANAGPFEQWFADELFRNAGPRHRPQGLRVLRYGLAGELPQMACAARGRTHVSWRSRRDGQESKNQKSFPEGRNRIKLMWMLLLFAVVEWREVEQLVARGNYVEAQAQLARIPKVSARWHVLSSKIHDGLNDPATAVAEAEAALRMAPRDEAALVQLGSIFLSHNTPDAALDVFTEAQKILPESLLIRLGRGLTFKELQLWEEAEAELSRCLPHVLAFDALATILIQRARFADADQMARRFVAAAPQDYRGWYFVAAVKEAQDQAGVETDVRKSIALRPQFAASHALSGKWLLKNGRFAEAATELEQATRLRPDLVQAHLHLARTYQELGRKEDATREFSVVKELKEKEMVPRQRLLFHRGTVPQEQ